MLVRFFVHAFRHRGSAARAAAARYTSRWRLQLKLETKLASAPELPQGIAQKTLATLFLVSLLFLLGFKVELRIDHGSGKFDFRRVAELEKGSTVFDLLSKEREKGELDFAYRDFGKMGALIESIDGYKNGKSRKYWKFWVNNKFSRVGASNYVLKNKDRVIWRYAK